VQPGLRTIQGELEVALARILPEPVQLTVAGRTDAGVHAHAQVTSFVTEALVPDHLSERLNAVLPRDLAVVDAGPATDGFDARRAARSRTYCYRVLASPLRDPFEEGRALWWPHPADFSLLERCASATVGTHDFTAFTPTDTDHVRFERQILRCEWRRAKRRNQGELWELWIEADAFMRHMVRILVGTMLEVAGGRREVADFERLLSGAQRPAAGETAPAHGLYLAEIRYREPD
jgi:tRNA pseudouridine38-40 synthase